MSWFTTCDADGGKEGTSWFRPIHFKAISDPFEDKEMR